MKSVMIENPYESPVTSSFEEEVVRQLEPTSWMVAIRAGMWSGTKWGFVITGALATLIGIIAWAIVLTFFHPTTSLKVRIEALAVFPLGVLCYASCGAVLGGVVMGLIAFLQFRKRKATGDRSQNVIHPNL